jgi:hypothetical protein
MSYREDDTASKPARQGDKSGKPLLLVAATRCLHLANQLDHSIRQYVIPGWSDQTVSS